MTVRLATVLLLAVSLSACAGGGFEPRSIESVPFRDRAVTQVDGKVTVTAAVPSKAETHDLFGVSLYRKGIQPVWIEIENATDHWIAYLPAGTDLEYDSSFEVASIGFGSKKSAQAEEYFFRNSVDMDIAPGATRSGFIFTKLDEGTKAFNVDVVGGGTAWQFTFFIPVPGLDIDHHEVDFEVLYERNEIRHFSDAGEFTAALEQLPCCTVDAKGEHQGDPLNLVLIGEPIDVYYAVLRANWDETEVVTAASGFKTAMSFISGGEYRYSPVSSLYLFGRRQDIALQKIRKNIHERNHFRLWLAPMTFEGKPVWIGQISRDIGVRLTRKTITTHKIDPDVDETREFLLENFAYSQVLAKIAYVGGVGSAPIDTPRANLTGDPYFTDGLRVVLWIASEPTDLDDIGYEAWSDPEG